MKKLLTLQFFFIFCFTLLMIKSVIPVNDSNNVRDLSIHEALAQEDNQGAAVAWNFFYADDDSMVQPYYIPSGVSGYNYYLLDQDTDFLPQDSFRVYISGLKDVQVLSVYGFIKESYTYYDPVDDKNKTVSDYTKKEYQKVLNVSRGMNPSGAGPYADLYFGKAQGFGEVRPERMKVVVSYRNLNVSFFHQTHPVLLPETKTILERTFENWMFIAATAVVLFGSGGYIGRRFKDRAGIVPKINIWTIIAFAAVALSLGLFYLFIQGPEGAYSFYDILLISPWLILIIPLGFLAPLIYSSLFAPTDLRKTLIMKMPEIPFPSEKDAQDDFGWNLSNFKKYYKTTFDWEIHTLLSYTRTDGKEFFVSEKRKDKWLDAFYRFFRGKGIVFEHDSMSSTMHMTAGKSKEKTEHTQLVCERVIPVWEFDYQSEGITFGKKSKFGNYPIAWAVICVVAGLVLSLMGRTLDLTILFVNTADLSKTILTIGILAAAFCLLIFIAEHWPQFRDPRIEIVPVDNRDAVDAINDVRAVKLAEMRAMSLHHKMLVMQSSHEKEKLQVGQDMIVLLDLDLKATDDEHFGIAGPTEKRIEELSKMLEQELDKRKLIQEAKTPSSEAATK